MREGSGKGTNLTVFLKGYFPSFSPSPKLDWSKVQTASKSSGVSVYQGQRRGEEGGLGFWAEDYQHAYGNFINCH